MYLKVNFDNLNKFLDHQNRCLDKQNWLREYQYRFLDYHWFGNYRNRNQNWAGDYWNRFLDYQNCFGDYRNRFCGQAARTGGLCCGSLAAASPSPCITSRKRKRNLKSSRNMFPWNGLLGCWHHFPRKEI